jgi:primosomal protein N'
VNQNQEEKNKYIVEKLAAMGITDPFLVTSVLSQSDKDFQIIVQHIQNYAQAQQNNAQSQLQLLQWLSEQNYITRADMQRLIIPLLDDMTSRSNPRGSVSSFLAGGQVTSDRQLPASTDDTSNQQTANQTTPRPTITRRRSVDNDDNPDTIPSDSQNTSHGAASQESHDDDSGPAIKQRRSVSFSDQDE